MLALKARTLSIFLSLGRGAMATDNHEKIVDFELYCPKCKYYVLTESDDPCWDCLGKPTNLNSQKPTEFVENSFSK